MICFCGSCLLLPAAAESLIELNECEQFVGLRLRKIKLGGKVVGLVGENLEITGDSAFVANIGKVRGTLGGGGKKLLLLAKFAEFAITDQRVGNFAEGLLDGLLIGKDSLLLLGFGKPNSGANFTSGKDGLSERAGNTPESGGCRQKGAQVRRFGSPQRRSAKFEDSRRRARHRSERWQRSRSCSDWRISGRRSRSSEGIPAGTSGG